MIKASMATWLLESKALCQLELARIQGKRFLLLAREFFATAICLAGCDPDGVVAFQSLKGIHY